MDTKAAPQEGGMTEEQQKYVDYIKPYIEGMTPEQLKAVRAFVGEVFGRELMKELTVQDSRTFELAEKIYLALKAAGCGIGNASIHTIQRELIGAAETARVVADEVAPSERVNFIKPTEPGDNYEIRLLDELSRLTEVMVWNRRRVRTVMGELNKLWDEAGEA